MTYVTEQTSTELRAHMRRLQKMPGWHNPLDDRLFAEIVAQDAELGRLRAMLDAAPGAPGQEAAAVQSMSEQQIWDWWASENGLEDCDMCKLEHFRRMVRAVEGKLAALPAGAGEKTS